MRELTVDAVLENEREKQQANADIPEDIIRLPERNPSSPAHIASPRLVRPEQAKDLEVQVIKDASPK
jgi:hypothetical protein